MTLLPLVIPLSCDDKTVIMEMYENLYQYTNHVGVHTDFYLFDGDMNTLISNQTCEPEFIQLAKNAKWGIIEQIKRNQQYQFLLLSVPLNVLVRKWI